MRIAVISDTHGRDYASVRPTEPADVLVIAGDVGSVFERQQQLLSFVSDACRDFPTVVFVPGNHEFYGGSLAEGRCRLKALATQLPNLHVLCRDRLVHDGVCFLGAVLWTGTTDEGFNAGHNDFRCIDGLAGVLDTAREHGLDKAYLWQEAARARGVGHRVVIVTHHPPVQQGTSHPMYAPSDVFACRLDEEAGFEHCCDLWLHGHTHYSHQQIAQGVTVVSNQVGHPHEAGRTRWQRNCIVEV